MRGPTSMPASPNDPAASSLGKSRPPDKSVGLRRTKKADFEKSAFCLKADFRRSRRLECVHVKLDGALQVGGLVLVHDVVLGQLVEHRRNLRQESFGCALLGRRTQSLHGVAGRLVEQAVVCALGRRLTDSFLRGLMVCHNSCKFIFLFSVCLLRQP